MVQTLTPTADVTAGASWRTDPTTGVAIESVIDEAAADDADRVISGPIPSGSVGDIFEIQLSSGTEPNTGISHTVSYRLRGYSEHSLKVELMQGTTRIAWWSEDALTTSDALYTHTLTSAQANSITDYANLRLRFTAVASFQDDTCMAFPHRVVGMYHQLYPNADSPNLEEYYFPSQINVVYLAFGYGSPLSIPGYTPEGQTAFLNRIRRLRRAGVRCVLSVGGSGNTISTTNTTNFVNEVMAINAVVPLDGLDWDVEAGALVQADVLTISAALKLPANRGPNFSITMAPPGNYVSAYLPVAVALQAAGNLTMYSQQYYDAAVTESEMMTRLTEAVNAGITVDHLGIGMMCDEGDSGPTMYWDVATCVSRVQVAKQTYPYLRGGFVWPAGTAAGNSIPSWADLVGDELLYVPSPPPVLVASWTFDTTSESWTGNVTPVRSTTTPKTGAGCLLNTATGSGNLLDTSPQFAVTEGQDYVAYLWVRTEITALDTFGYFDWYDSGSVFISGSDGSYQTTPLNTYSQVTWTAQAPPGAAFAKINFYAVSAAAADRFRIDDVSVYRPADGA